MDQQSREPCARLCHIVKWEDFDGYGFNLHAEKGKHGQFIGKVDEGSPSEAAGLRQGDRIVEVNEISIANETHKQVVERIKAFPNETKLLVVDQQADDFYKANNVPIKGTMPGISYLKTPERSPGDALDRSCGTSDTHSIGSSSSHQHQENGNSSTHETATAIMDDSVSNKSSTSSSGMANNNSNNSISNSNSNSNGNSTLAASNNQNGTAGTLNLAMSAKELRAKLAQRKKYDPKKESMGFKDKFDIVQKL